MIRVVTSNVSYAGILVEMAPERVTRTSVCEVAKGDPGAAQNVVVETVDEWQSEIGVGWIDLEAIHDCCNADTVSPNVACVGK